MLCILLVKFGPAAEGYLQSAGNVPCSTCVDGGVWLRISRQFSSSSHVRGRGRGIALRHYNGSLAKVAVRKFRDGAVVPFE
jgi:hypothetical protein